MAHSEFTKYDNEGINNTVNCLTNKVVRSTLSIIGNNNTVDIESNVRLNNCRIVIKGDDCCLRIYNNSTVKGALHITGNHSYIQIGKNTMFTSNHSTLSVQEDNMSISIGNNCLVGDCLMRTSDSHSILDRTTGKRINFAKSIIIRDRVWIAQGVKILKGVIIEDEIVVGASSLVVKSLEKSYSIYAGNPAKLIKENIIWDKNKLKE